MNTTKSIQLSEYNPVNTIDSIGLNPIDNEEMVNLEKALAHSLALCAEYRNGHQLGLFVEFNGQMFIQQIANLRNYEVRITNIQDS